MSQRFVSLNGLRPALIPADYPDASLKWCYLHLKEQDWESSSFLAQLCSDLLCYSLSWQTGQIHTHRAVINNLNLAAKEKVRGWVWRVVSWVTASVLWLYWEDQVCICILLSSQPPHITGPQSGGGNGQLKQLLPGRTVQTISTLAQLKPSPCPWRFMGTLIWCYTQYEKSRWICCSSIFLPSLLNSTL